MLPEIRDNMDTKEAEIWTEGKSDWRILKKAFQVLNRDLNLSFHETDKDMGGDKLLKKVETFSETWQETPLIFIFDHDDTTILPKVDIEGNDFKDWGNNVYSFSLPIPTNRKNHEQICIELYFTDEEIHRKDSNGRQLFLSSDFNEKSGNHIDKPYIHCNRTSYLSGFTGQNKVRIVSDEVYDEHNQNIALSKTDFAKYIYEGKPPFDKFNFSEFSRVLDIVERIIQVSKPNQYIYFPDPEIFFLRIGKKSSEQQFHSLFNLITDVISIGLEIFIISTIRIYESEIINEPTNYKKKVIPIKRIVTEAFRKPSLNTLQELALKCYYLIDDKAPDVLCDMKEALNSYVQLGEIGQFWDDLETIFSTDPSQPKFVNKSAINRNFLEKVIPEIASYSSKPLDVIQQGISSIREFPHIQITTWKQALLRIVNILDPVFSCPIIFKSIKSRDPLSDEYILEVTTYINSKAEKTTEQVDRLSDDYERKSSELVLGDDIHIHLYPFLMVRDNALYFYKSTQYAGYEYYSISHNKTYIEPNKKKFNQSLFIVGSKQGLFWTDVLPRNNPKNGIRANIPDEGPYEFIGRRKQINKIKEEIVNIVNENGIVYGPGGIGKTSLMIQLSKELFEEKDPQKILYDNIIWVSAKRNFYDYVFDKVEIREPQIKSLDNVLFAILNFFEFEGLDEYSHSDRKELTLELFKENKILLVVDNFETVSKIEAEKIIDFFGTHVKKVLKTQPGNFKIILTSREMIPTGFRQIELHGLERRESNRLIDSLYKRYKSTQPILTDDQKEKIYLQTKGIPIIIRHCIAKMYEYNQSFDIVFRSLSNFSGNIVQFSYKEILDHIESEKGQIGLQVLILFEIVDIPLMIRQISDILEIQEHLIETRLPELSNFECIKRINLDNQEKYILNDEIRLLTKSLVQRHRDLLQEVRRKYFRNFSFDKRLDYTTEEEEIIEIFEGYLKNREFTDAEDFIKKELKKRPNSILMNYYYARYLKERKNDLGEAIKILENLRKLSRNHPTILKMLFICYSSLSIPQFENADNLVNQIQAEMGNYLEEDLDLQLEIVRFYVRNSISLKVKRGIDPYEDNLRQAQYKELAQKALNILRLLIDKFSQVGNPSTLNGVYLHEVYYRSSQCYYNLWNYDDALMYINKAIALVSQADNKFPLQEYEKFKNNIVYKDGFYSRKPWLEQD